MVVSFRTAQGSTRINNVEQERVEDDIFIVQHWLMGHCRTMQPGCSHRASDKPAGSMYIAMSVHDVCAGGSRLEELLVGRVVHPF